MRRDPVLADRGRRDPVSNQGTSVSIQRINYASAKIGFGTLLIVLRMRETIW